MEIIIVLILIALALYLLYLLFVYVILPISGIALVATLVIGVGYALCVSVYSFIKSMICNRNPYLTYRETQNVPHGVKRIYFFGPGYHQIGSVVKEAFSELLEHVEKLTEFRKDKTGYRWYFNVLLWIFYLVALLFLFVFGFLWMAAFSTLLATVIFSAMLVFYVIFFLLWGTDRLILAAKSVQSRCGNCKRISIVPTFACSGCGIEHHKLTPGKFGVFKRKCSCGIKLPTTFMNGRSKLKANCPFCNHNLASSAAKQIGIQLVGGVSCGKTTFLAAFWHLYLEQLKVSSLQYEKHPTEGFDELEHWFSVGLSASTLEVNASMYSIVHKLSEKESYQLTIYDIAGEAFNDLSNNEQQQQQFKYCEAIIFVIDPTLSPDVSTETLANFIREFRGLKGAKATKISDVPIAVVISKSDLFKKEIGLPKIKSKYTNNQSEFQSLEATRNETCREYLRNHNYVTALNLIDSEFTNAQFYPVSAIGHEAVMGQAYEPWGIIEPMLWLIQSIDSSFSQKVVEKHLNFNQRL
jgi:GTPase SAR1 family protein